MFLDFTGFTLLLTCYLLVASSRSSTDRVVRPVDPTDFPPLPYRSSGFNIFYCRLPIYRNRILVDLGLKPYKVRHNVIHCNQLTALVASRVSYNEFEESLCGVLNTNNRSVLIEQKYVRQR